MHAQHEAAARAEAPSWFGLTATEAGVDEDSGITVMVASDRVARHATWLSWMSWESGIAMAGQPVTDPQALADAVERLRPQVLLLEATMLDRLDAASIRRIQACPHLRVLLLSDQAGRPDVAAVLRHRFQGVLPAASPAFLYLKAVRAVSAGELWLSRQLMASFLSDEGCPALPATAGGFMGPGGVCDTKALTRRERQVVASLHEGRSNKEIARELGIVEDTVKKHLKSVYAKLGVRRRAMVILQASANA